MVSICFSEGAVTYNPEDFSRSKIYSIKRYCLKMIQEKVSSSNAEIFWASLPPCLCFAGSDFLGKTLWVFDGGTKE